MDGTDSTASGKFERQRLLLALTAAVGLDARGYKAIPPVQGCRPALRRKPFVDTRDIRCSVIGR